MSRARFRLPLPSRCIDCHLAVKAVRHSVDHTFTTVWVHDAALAMGIRKGGAHQPAPDPSYQPQRGRVVGPARDLGIDLSRMFSGVAVA